ncbi:ATP-binding protein [Microvirga sp. 2YAF29]|uniref:hybrid sensor histidine kinase/response regulator n=1 Tax=Microvirga sp. 2YAF29 TaxID=3233031 RepID=UPI003F98DBCF
MRGQGAKIVRAGARLGRLHRNSLLWRFFLIGIATLAPLSAALVQFAENERKLAATATRERAEMLIAFAVEGQERIIEEAKATLSFLAAAPELHADKSVCGEYLQRHLAMHHWMSALRVSDMAGRELCSSQVGDEPRSQGSHEIFDRLLHSEGFALSDVRVDALTGKLGMTAAVSVQQSGRPLGVVSLDMTPALLERHSLLELDPVLDTKMLVVDRNGTLVAHYPDRTGFVGASLQREPVIRRALEAPYGNAELADLTGEPRLFVFRPLPGTDAVLAIGLNQASVIGAIDQTLRYRLFLVIVIVSGSLLLAMLGVEGLILRPLRSLVKTAEALERGDFSIRSPYKGSGEVRILERAFNRMAQAVADREHQLIGAKEVAERALSGANIASTAKTNFLASMSHEIRTPLNGIIGYTEQLLDEKLNAKQRRSVNLIQVSASALLTVANDILDFSSIEADQINLQPEPFSLVALVDNTVSIVSSGADNKDVPIRIEWDPRIPRLLMGDEARIRQVLLNLLNNAVKFTREGNITTLVHYVGSSEAGETIRISVVDTGIGITPEQHKRLFKRFSQGDPSIRREFGGTGLGLAISKRLIELMGGQIGVESEQGRGSTFWIELTLPEAQALSELEGGVALPVARPSRILVVEDVEINRELVQVLLEAVGHTVDAVSNGDEAVTAVQAVDYDLVLMDIQMPGMDGLTAVKEIRALKHPTSQVFIAAMTANVLPQQVRSFMRRGFNDHIGKPVRRDDLFRKLGEWLPEDEAEVEEPRLSPRISFKESHFEDFTKTIGPERVRQWLMRLDEELRETFAKGCFVEMDRARIGKSAHAITSQAALLGFSELAELCTILERECVTGEDVAISLDRVCEASRKVRNIIAQMEILSAA